MMADTLAHTVIQCIEPEATSRGAALIALERLGVIPGIRAGPAQTGSRIEPIEKNGAIYMAALERQRHLYNKLFEEKQ
jgi:gluconokinase